MVDGAADALHSFRKVARLEPTLKRGRLEIGVAP